MTIDEAIAIADSVVLGATTWKSIQEWREVVDRLPLGHPIRLRCLDTSQFGEPVWALITRNRAEDLHKLSSFLDRNQVEAIAGEQLELIERVEYDLQQLRKKITAAKRAQASGARKN